MNILSKKVKKEIKTLIHRIEYCKTYLPTLKEIHHRYICEPENYRPEALIEHKPYVEMEIVKTEKLLRDARNRLRELGVY